MSKEGHFSVRFPSSRKVNLTYIVKLTAQRTFFHVNVMSKNQEVVDILYHSRTFPVWLSKALPAAERHPIPAPRCSTRVSTNTFYVHFDMML
jgi:hypothetical protein